MVNSQEIIERSIYMALLRVTVELGYGLDPNNYLPVSIENSEKFQQDLKNLNKYIPIIGTGNATSKDQKITPRIVLNARGFYPGNIGLPKELIEKSEGIGFTANEEPYETLDQYIDVHLVASNQDDLRLLHQIMFWALPQRGYIKPYTAEKFLPSGNIFIEVGNFFDYPNVNAGLLEKVYEYKVQDTLIGEKEDVITDIAPMTSVTVLLEKYGLPETLLQVQEKSFNPDFSRDFS